MAAKKAEKWKLTKCTPGRVPRWVLDQTGTKGKAELTGKVKFGTVFVREPKAS